VSEITMIAITKTHPASDVGLLAELGVTDVGENRDQEAAAKAAECARLGVTGLTWHFVGQLQTNKASSVVRYADVVHSVDRERLVRALGTQARRAGRTVTCLAQVSLDTTPDHASSDQATSGHAAPDRGGAAPSGVPALTDAIAAEEGLVLGGVMAVAPLGQPAAPAFGRLAEIAAGVRAAHPDAIMISAGMSADLEVAVAAGATHLRVGTALLGARSTFVG
jgi:pyridoxal phosphate enzyme (YggS family)